MVGPVSIVMLLRDGFEGSGGIAKFQQRFHAPPQRVSGAASGSGRRAGGFARLARLSSAPERLAFLAVPR
jgi:hypothetical protein